MFVFGVQGFRVCGSWVPRLCLGFGVWVQFWGSGLGSGLCSVRVSGYRGSGFRGSGFGFHGLGFRVQVHFRGLGSCFRSGFWVQGFRVLGFRVRFRFGALGFGCRFRVCVLFQDLEGRVQKLKVRGMSFGVLVLFRGSFSGFGFGFTVRFRFRGTEFRESGLGDWV